MNIKNKYKAYLCFLLLVLIASAPCIVDAAILSSERAALIALYNSTNGDNWTNKSGWKTSPIYTDGFSMPGTENSWYGVVCNSENTAVLEIDLSDNSLIGMIPCEIGNLGNLQKIYINNNQLTGSIPAELGNLSDLQWLILECNELTGAIPVELGNLDNLQVLDLFGNFLTGSIPVQLSNLDNLIALSLGSNRLTGMIPNEFSKLSNLRGLYLHSNQLTDSIPPELGNLTKLQYLYLDNNQLTGTIPETLGNLVNMEYLRLQGNQLTGAIPASLVNLNLLSYINLHYNSLHTENEDLLLFLSEKTPGWQNTQTIPPDNVRAQAKSSNSVLLSWSPVEYNVGSGNYIVSYRTSPDEPYTVFDTTVNKNIGQIEIAGLISGKNYFFVVQTKTEPHENNKNTVISGYSVEVSAKPYKNLSWLLLLLEDD
jgi:hypothetical protein